MLLHTFMEITPFRIIIWPDWQGGCNRSKRNCDPAVQERPEEDLLESSFTVKKPVTAFNMQCLGHLKDLRWSPKVLVENGPFLSNVNSTKENKNQTKTQKQRQPLKTLQLTFKNKKRFWFCSNSEWNGKEASFCVLVSQFLFQTFKHF